MRVLLTIAFALALVLPARSNAAGAETTIKSILTRQAEDWNRGDVLSFVGVYSEDCTFVGKTILTGRAALLARYRQTYPSKDAMGKLTFGNLVIHQLDSNVAVVTGEWHIDRTSSAGSAIGGIFSLVWQLQNGTWQIVLDHTT
jgi:ketosteroid isomerase-like protein